MYDNNSAKNLERLKPHLYRLMILELTRSGELIKLSESLSQIRNASPIELGFAGETLIPDANDVNSYTLFHFYNIKNKC